MNELIQLFAVFARIGAVTFGGGYAMLPILQAEVVEKYHWASEEELAQVEGMNRLSARQVYEFFHVAKQN